MTQESTLNADLRSQARHDYLRRLGWDRAEVEPLAADASFRRYFRLRQQGALRILMDAPPPQENITPFIEVAQHLSTLGLRPPGLFDYDLKLGFALLEDLGDQTFTRLLAQGESETALYDLAVDNLVALHLHAQNSALPVPAYDAEVMLREVSLLIDWYLPALTGRAVSKDARNEWTAAWQQMFTVLPVLPDVFVLRDFHVDNLMRLSDGRCALLDFQDALIGSPAYDVASLLEDARRDLPEPLRDSLKAEYLRAVGLSAASFEAHYQFWAMQRHAKVLGIFLRLWLRDNKPGYLKHIPRVLALFQRRLDDNFAAPLAAWLQRYFPELDVLCSDSERLTVQYQSAIDKSELKI